MRLLPASTTNTSPFTPTAAATGLENVGIVAPLLVKEAWAWPAFAGLVVKSACPSTAMATGGGLAKVVSPEARAGQLLYALKMSNRLSPVSNTAGPLLIMTKPDGLLRVLAVAPEGAGSRNPARGAAALPVEKGGGENKGGFGPGVQNEK